MNDTVASYLQTKYGMTIVTWSDDSKGFNNWLDLVMWYRRLNSGSHLTLNYEDTGASMALEYSGRSIKDSRSDQLLTVADCLDMDAYVTTTGEPGIRDSTWTCTGTWSPPDATTTCPTSATATATDPATLSPGQTTDLSTTPSPSTTDTLTEPVTSTTPATSPNSDTCGFK